MIGYVIFVVAVVALLSLPAVLVRRAHRRAKEQIELTRSMARARGELR